MVNLTTPFEDSGGTINTTLEQEATFLEDVKAASNGRMDYSQIGTSGGGRPYNLVRIGNPAPALEGVTPGRCLLVLGSIHGNEVSGRESALTLIRDYATSSDPEIADYLLTHTLLVIPTANPDGTRSGARAAGGHDLNRIALTLNVVEARHIASVIQQTQPVIVVDLHEMHINPDIRPKVELSAPPNANIDPELSELSANLVVDMFDLFPDVVVDHYVSNFIEQWITTSVGLRGAIGIICEVLRQEPGSSRIEWSRRVTDYLIGYHAENSDMLLGLTQKARQRATQAGANRDPFFLPARLDPAPAAYRITPSQRAILEHSLSGFGIKTVPVWDRSGDHLVSMAQPSRNVIPFLMDPSAPRNLVSAGRLDSDGPDPAVPRPEALPRIGKPIGYKVGLNGRSTVPQEIRTLSRGQTVTIWQRP